jgi:hypothetical protein
MDSQASLWTVMLFVSIAGGIGGAVNAYLSDNGFAFPKHEKLDGSVIIRPGFLGTMAVGAVAAVVSWGLYGPFASAAVVGPGPATGGDPPSLAVSALVGAVLVGIGGGRWLTDYSDKQLLKAAAVKATAAAKDTGTGAQMAIASPAGALEVVRNF